MANIQKTASTGFPFFGILSLIFITLKLCNIITWSWWWVLAPLWGAIRYRTWYCNSLSGSSRNRQMLFPKVTI